MGKKKHDFLDHFVEKPPENPPESPAVADPAPQKETEPKNYGSFLRYITIMFVMAFIFVLLSFIVSHRDSQQTISQLNQNANSALTRAEQLQSDNRALAEQNTALQQEIDGLNEDMATKEEALLEKDEKISALETEKEQLLTENTAIKTKAENTAKAYGYLAEAQLAFDEERLEDCAAALESLKPLREYLDQKSQSLCDRLAQKLTETPEN